MAVYAQAPAGFKRACGAARLAITGYEFDRGLIGILLDVLLDLQAQPFQIGGRVGLGTSLVVLFLNHVAIFGQRTRHRESTTWRASDTLKQRNLNMGVDPGYALNSSLMNGGLNPYHQWDNQNPNVLLSGAIDAGDYEAVYYLIYQRNADLSAINDHGLNPIHQAVNGGHMDIMTLLLVKAAEGNSNAMNEMDRHGYTPLMLAVEHCDTLMVKTLIGYGATIQDGMDVNCSASKLARKNQTIAHVRLLLETGGNTAAAHQLAIKRGVSSFENLVDEQHAALRSKCECGDLQAATAMIKAGADGASVLIRILVQDEMVSVIKATAVKTLIDAGVDVSEVLLQVIELRAHTRAIQPLLVLGASGERAMEAAAKKKDRSLVQYLALERHVNGDAVLMRCVKNRNGDAVRVLVGGLVGESDVLAELIKTNDKKGLEFLIAHSKGAEILLLDYLDAGNSAAVKALVDAGVDTSRAVNILTDRLHHFEPFKQRSRLTTARVDIAAGIRADVWPPFERSIHMKQLRMLAVAGVDMSRLLYAKATGAKDLNSTNLVIMRILIAAGARAGDALRHAPKNERPALKKVFDVASREVAAAKQIMSETKGADIDFVGHLFLARQRMTHRAKTAMSEKKLKEHEGFFVDCELNTAMRQGLRYFEAQGKTVQLQLLRAIENIDWTQIKKLAADHDAAAEVLLCMLETGNQNLTRLMMAAGADPSLAVAKAVEKRYVKPLLRLIDLGWPAERVLESLIDSGSTDVAKELIAQSGFDRFEMIVRLVDHDEMATLRKIVPTLVNGTWDLGEACERNMTAVVKALLDAGVDGNKTLCTLLERGAVQAAHVLMRGGVDKSSALVQAITNASATAAQFLLFLDADPVAAFDHATIRKQKGVADRLARLSVGESLALNEPVSTLEDDDDERGRCSIQ